MNMPHKPKDVFEQGVQGRPVGGFNSPSSLKAIPDTSSLSDQKSPIYAWNISKPGNPKGCFSLGFIYDAGYVGIFLYTRYDSCFSRKTQDNSKLLVLTLTV